MKGVSAAVVALLIIVVLLGFGVTIAYLSTLPRKVEVEYTGEFDDGYLATKAWFASDFIEQVDCNITDDILGYKIDGACVYRTGTAWNETSNPEVNYRDWEFSWVFDIDDDVEYVDVSVDLVGDAEDYAYIKDAKIYTHEDNPTLVYDLQPYIEDQTSIDAKTGPLAGDEYVLYLVLHTKDVDEKFTTGENIAEIELELGTDGDVDKAYVTLESA